MCSDFLFLYASVIVDCVFLGIYPFLIVCPICWYIIVHSSLLWSFVSLYQLQHLLFHFWFYLFESFLFFSLGSLAEVLSILFNFSKNQLLIALLLFFLVSIISCISFLNFVISFLLQAYLRRFCDFGSRSLQ